MPAAPQPVCHCLPSAAAQARACACARLRGDASRSQADGCGGTPCARGGRGAEATGAPAAGAAAAGAPAAAPRHQKFDNSSNKALFSRLTDDLHHRRSSQASSKQHRARSAKTRDRASSTPSRRRSTTRPRRARGVNLSHKTCFSAHRQAYHCARPAWTGWSLFTLQSRHPTR